MPNLSEKELQRILQQDGYELVGGGLADVPRQRQVAKTETPTEHEEQVRLFNMLEQHAARFPDLRLAFAIPNGGHRYAAVAGKLKAEGVKAGVPDIFLPVPASNSHGLWIEMKRADRSNHPTELQCKWMTDLGRQGYDVAVCYGADAAFNEICEYLEIDP